MGGPKFCAFFRVSHPFLVVFWWCMEASGRQMFTFGVLGLSCEALAAPKPPGFHTTAREPKRAPLRPGEGIKERNFGRSGGGGSGRGMSGGRGSDGRGSGAGWSNPTTTQPTRTTTNNNHQQQTPHEPQQQTATYNKTYNIHNSTQRHMNGLTKNGLAKIGWPKVDWPKFDWPKSATTVWPKVVCRLEFRMFGMMNETQGNGLV